VKSDTNRKENSFGAFSVPKESEGNCTKSYKSN